MKYTNSMNKSVYWGVGHGGSDNGACANGYHEDDLALEISKYGVAFLERRGIKTYISRKKDSDSDINSKVATANRKNVDVCLDTHINAGKGDGEEVCYLPSSKSSKRLATFVDKAIVKHTVQNSRGLKPRTDLGMLNYPKMPAILVECGFIDNKKDLKDFATTKAVKEAMGNAIAKGICNYLKIRWCSYKIKVAYTCSTYQAPTIESPKTAVLKKDTIMTIYRLSSGGKWGYTSEGWIKLSNTVKVK